MTNSKKKGISGRINLPTGSEIMASLLIKMGHLAEVLVRKLMLGIASIFTLKLRRSRKSIYLKCGRRLATNAPKLTMTQCSLSTSMVCQIMSG